MGVINRVPKGLLGLLDAKTQGETPANTTGTLSPVIDLTPNYLADRPFQLARGQFSTNAINIAVAQVIVPAGELWYVYGASFQLAATANSAFWGNLLFAPADGGVIIDWLSLTNGRRDAQTYNAGEGPSHAVQFGPPLLCSSGNTFAFSLKDDPGGANPVNITVNVLYRSVQV